MERTLVKFLHRCLDVKKDGDNYNIDNHWLKNLRNIIEETEREATNNNKVVNYVEQQSTSLLLGCALREKKAKITLINTKIRKIYSKRHGDHVQYR
jgi:uncharacterized protein (UPF0128 family)